MHNFSPILHDTGSPALASQNLNIYLVHQANQMFEHARWLSFVEKMKCFILRRNNHLMDLECMGDTFIYARHYGGLKPVRISAICGSLGRAQEFDRLFLPLDDRLRDRWINIAIARCQFLPLEPVQLIQVDDCFYVVDGHHRISVARVRGEMEIDAEVVIWEKVGTFRRTHYIPKPTSVEVA